jgi:hypothetical protein
LMIRQATLTAFHDETVLFFGRYSFASHEHTSITLIE